MRLQSRRPLFLLVSAHIVLGSLCYTLIFNRLQPLIGFRHTVWIMALTMVMTLLVPIGSLRIRLPQGPCRRIFEAAAWKEPAFVLWALCLFVSLLGLYLPSVYIQLYGMDYMSEDLAFYLLPVSNAGSFFGRLVRSRSPADTALTHTSNGR